MTEPLTLRRERVADIPLLLAHLDRMGLQPLLDEHVPTHGTWVGLSLGWVTVRWLTPILSEAEHRLNHMHPWAVQRLHPWRGATGQRGHPLDLRDDRLAAVLATVRDEARGPACAGAFTQQLVRVYDLQAEPVRLDATTASGDWRVTADGRLPCGDRKDHRPDLPQVKVRRSVLEPLGWPVATDVVPGPRAADPLYLPAIARVREGLGRRGRLDWGRLPAGRAGDPGPYPGRWRLRPGSVGGDPPAAGRLGGLRGRRGRGIPAVEPHHPPDRHGHPAVSRRRRRTAGTPDR